MHISQHYFTISQFQRTRFSWILCSWTQILPPTALIFECLDGISQTLGLLPVMAGEEEVRLEEEGKVVCLSSIPSN